MFSIKKQVFRQSNTEKKNMLKVKVQGFWDRRNYNFCCALWRRRNGYSFTTVIKSTIQKTKFSIEDFFSKCNQICRKLFPLTFSRKLNPFPYWFFSLTLQKAEAGARRCSVKNMFTLHKICEKTGFHWPVFFRIRTESQINKVNKCQWKPVFSHILWSVKLLKIQ